MSNTDWKTTKNGRWWREFGLIHATIGYSAETQTWWTLLRFPAGVKKYLEPSQGVKEAQERAERILQNGQ